MRVVTHHVVDAAGLRQIRQPRRDVLVEEPVEGDRFISLHGPVGRYERTLDIRDDEVVETTELRLALPFWTFLFFVPYRLALRRPPHLRTKAPWWAPPQPLDARASTVLGLLCAISLIDGYVSTVLTQTVTYATAEFGASSGAQGATLAVARFGALVTLLAGALADRHGRRRLLLLAAAAACLTAAVGALAPNLWFLGASQLVAAGCAGALGLLVAIVSAEEVPAGSRAYAFSLIVMAGALGAGMCLWALPLADLGVSAWRLVYVVPLLGLPLVWTIARRLPESRRFAAPHARDVDLASHGRRFWLLCTTGLLIALFALPATQFQNDFLRRERGFSAAHISVFVIVTSTPAIIGIVAGAWWADRHGRRAVGAVGIAGGTVLTVLMFAATGWPMWTWSLLASIAAALTVPALGVYRPELFPTGLRGKAFGAIEIVALVGGGIGLVVVGWLDDRWGSYAGPMALLGIAGLAAAVLVLVAFPETAGKTLDDLNPVDRAPTLR